MLHTLKNILLPGRSQSSINRDILVSHKHRFILFTNAKCGCGTAKEWFLYIHNIIEDQHISSGVDDYLGKSVHDFIRDPKTRFCATEKGVLQLAPHTKIIVVRNPWKRIVSFYTDKILIPAHWLPALNVLTKENYSKDITFREFVHSIEQIPDSALERHLQSQCYSHEHIDFDFIVKLERFNVDMIEVVKTLNLSQFSVPNIHRNRTHYSVNLTDVNISDKKPREINLIPPYQFFYDQELQD